MKPYKLASKELKQEPTIVEVGDVRIGGNEVVVMAGPCAIENEEIYVETAKKVKRQEPKYSAAVLSSPYISLFFPRFGREGLKIMAIAREVTGLKLVTEVVDTRDVELVASYTDIIQIGARNMQNFRLLKEVECPISPYS